MGVGCLGAYRKGFKHTITVGVWVDDGNTFRFAYRGVRDYWGRAGVSWKPPTKKHAAILLAEP